MYNINRQEIFSKSWSLIKLHINVYKVHKYGINTQKIYDVE